MHICFSAEIDIKRLSPVRTTENQDSLDPLVIGLYWLYTELRLIYGLNVEKIYIVTQLILISIN